MIIIIFSFSIAKPQNMQATLENLKQKATAHGGSVDGDETSGIIKQSGVEGRYTVNENAIEIVVLKKPSVLLPNRVIESEIRKIFREVAV